jgi:hypothetical protein
VVTTVDAMAASADHLTATDCMTAAGRMPTTAEGTAATIHYTKVSPRLLTEGVLKRKLTPVKKPVNRS